MDIPTMEKISATTVKTKRLKTRLLSCGPEEGIPVLFLHGNTSSATWWEESMTALPTGFRAAAPDQRGFGSADPEAKIDARRGLGDLVDDAIALLDELSIEKTHVVGNSLGGSVIWGIMVNHPNRLLSVTLVSPGSPFGFGGTKDIEGTPCYDDYAGSGGGLINAELIQRIESGDRSLESPFCPRSALRNLIVKPPFIPAREEELLTGMLSMNTGPQDSPGGSVPSPNWPFVGPGEWGPANALSPKYAVDISRLYSIEPKIPVLWVRGSHDLLVSDTAASDPGYLGMLGLIPGWPGEDVFPPQPMLGQTRSVLNKYASTGGAFEEVIIPDSGHIPFIEKPDEFNDAFLAFLKQNSS
jgi:pimeloyl-ACP methyl ester carboxylesterase